jgi:hypothetical protein
VERRVGTFYLKERNPSLKRPVVGILHCFMSNLTKKESKERNK